MKRLVHVPRPSVIDGRVELSQWFAPTDAAHAVKVDWDQGSSWNLGLGCCDPVFDLAGMTASSEDDALGRALRDAYQSMDGEPVDEERWLLYELAHLSAPGAPPEARPALRRACARAVQRYFRSVYFEDIACLTGWAAVRDRPRRRARDRAPRIPRAHARLGGRAAGADRSRLSTADRHGPQRRRRQERCRAYGLAGAVAEYGSATYDARDGHIDVLCGPDERREIERLRAHLAALDGVTLDADYTYAIRAFVRDGRGARGPLPAALLTSAKRAADAGEVSAVVGDAQTDIVASGIDKRRGASALAAALGQDGPTPFAFAVGDTATDLPLLALAVRPFAPAHAKEALGAHAVITSAPYQLGFAQAVGRVIGHAPGGCPLCTIGAGSRERRIMLGLLGVRDRGTRQLPLQIVKLSRLLRGGG